MFSTLLQYAAAASRTHRAMSPAPTDANPTRLYAESQLRLRNTMAHEPDAPGIVGELLRASSASQRRQLMRDKLEALGFGWLGYGTVVYARGNARLLSFFTGFAHEEWVRRYFANGHMDADVRHQDAPISSLPLHWDLDRLESMAAERAPDARMRLLLDDLRDCGLRSGLIFRLPSASQFNEHTVIGLQSARAGRDWITNEVAGQALMLSFSVHEYLSRHERVEEAAPLPPASWPEVSQTQQDILAQLLDGRSDKEIADRLSLSGHAVDYHMRQLRRRFAVRNRVQLVNAVMGACSG